MILACGFLTSLVTDIVDFDSLEFRIFLKKTKQLVLLNYRRQPNRSSGRGGCSSCGVSMVQLVSMTLQQESKSWWLLAVVGAAGVSVLVAYRDDVTTSVVVAVAAPLQWSCSWWSW